MNVRKFVSKLYQRLLRKPKPAKAITPISFRLPIRSEFADLQFSSHAIQKLLDEFEFATILDIGCGTGLHSDVFMRYGKGVTAIDYGNSEYFSLNKSNVRTIVADFNTYEFNQKFDCVWCSHVLEHQLNVNQFLLKVHRTLKADGILALTVPPLKHQIVGGHVNLFNAGIVLYHLILAGFDCSQASVLQYDYNISVIVKKMPAFMLPSDLSFDSGDIRKLRQYFPEGIEYDSEIHDDTFDGNIQSHNWQK